MARFLVWVIALVSLPAGWALAAITQQSFVPAEAAPAMVCGQHEEGPRWRRTVHGWEDARTWPQPRSSAQTVPNAVAPPSIFIHPLVFTAWLLVVCLSALKMWPAVLNFQPASATEEG